MIGSHYWKPHPLGDKEAYPVRQGSFARLRPRHSEKELHDGVVFGASEGPNNDGNFVEHQLDWGYTNRMLHSIEVGDAQPH